jgi:hypothetical protein
MVGTSSLCGSDPRLIPVRCRACYGTGLLYPDTCELPVACYACNSTGQVEMSEQLACFVCDRDGILWNHLVYQKTLGTVAIWRCSFGHDWAEEVSSRPS